MRVDARGRGRDRVDRDVTDPEARVVGELEPEDRPRRGPDVLGQVRVRRPEVGEGRGGRVVGRCRARGTPVEVARALELLRGEPRADDLSVPLDEAPLRLVGEGDRGEARHQRGIAEAEHEREDDHCDDRRDDRAHHQPISPSTIGPSVSAGKIIRPAVSAITPMSSTTNVGPSVRNVPAETGWIFFPASELAEG